MAGKINLEFQKAIEKKRILYFSKGKTLIKKNNSLVGDNSVKKSDITLLNSKSPQDNNNKIKEETKEETLEIEQEPEVKEEVKEEEFNFECPECQNKFNELDNGKCPFCETELE